MAREVVFQWQGDVVREDVRKGVDRILENAVRTIARRAERLAPKDTGRYAGTIKWVRGSARGTNITGKSRPFMVVTGDTEKPSVKGVPSALTGHIEHGTRSRAARKHIYRAYDATKAEIETELRGLVG